MLDSHDNFDKANCILPILHGSACQWGNPALVAYLQCILEYYGVSVGVG